MKCFQEEYKMEESLHSTVLPSQIPYWYYGYESKLSHLVPRGTASTKK